MVEIPSPTAAENEEFLGQGRGDGDESFGIPNGKRAGMQSWEIIPKYWRSGFLKMAFFGWRRPWKEEGVVVHGDKNDKFLVQKY